eukprot:TRINITY_DN25113_c0_g1_i1.p1 TRINITY_DN25113_c0_g1~~TRINITY_DN25113_c0_g1_i1.p1  ORF type:complete len:331 (+),score=133.03 TRINITY_DN25113_c0_g1_i1:62-1054(+)
MRRLVAAARAARPRWGADPPAPPPSMVLTPPQPVATAARRWQGGAPKAGQDTKTAAADASADPAASASAEEKEGAGKGKEEAAEEKAKAKADDFPVDKPMQGPTMQKWMDATKFDLNGFFIGVIQAYAAVAYVNLNERGKDRWSTVPVDPKAAAVLESHRSKKDEFNGSELAQRIAHPEDLLYRVSIKDYTLKADGEQYATVRLWVDTHPEALFGDDMEVAKKLFVPAGKEDEQSTLSIRFLELLYSAYFENERIPPSVRNRVIESWQGVRKTLREGDDPANAVAVSRFFKWFVQKQPKPRRLKEWVFRRDANGDWHLAELGVLCSRPSW